MSRARRNAGSQARLVAALLAVAVLHGGAGFAEPPAASNLQGRLVDDSGQPLPGPVNLTIRIYDDETAGTLLYQEDHAPTLLERGVFELVLGQGASPVGSYGPDLFAAFGAAHLELVVNGDALEPRQPFRSVPYAFEVPTPSCTIETEQMSVAAGATFSLSALCTGGEVTADTLHAGGFSWSGPEEGVWIWESSGSEFINAWTVRGKNSSAQTATVTAYARCCALPE